jgi:cyclic-di-GMP phosphodiesterase TipF (flagellum assembly factor)
MRLPNWLQPTRQLASATGGLALIAALWAGYVLPSPFDVMLSAFLAGAGALATGAILERALSARTEKIAAALGEVKIRLAHTNIKIENALQALENRPMSQADAAPARVAISELTAEVGILGGIVRDIANAMSEQDERLGTLETARPAARPAMAKPATPAAEVSEAVPAASPARQAMPAATPDAPLRSDRPSRLEGPLVARSDQAVQAQHLEVDAARGEAIAAALADGRVEVHLQPIMALPHRRPVGYEALARLRLDAQTLLLPAEFLPQIERRGLGPSFDALVLTQVLKVACYLHARGQGSFVSCNFCPSTWGETRAVAMLSRLFEPYRAESAAIIVEVPQRVFRALDPTSLGYLGGLSASGIGFAIDQVHDLRFDPASLRDRGVRFVKLGLGLMDGSGSGGLADIAPEDLVAYLSRNGIEVIAEKLGDNRAVADAMELSVRLAQGLALAQPRPIRSEILFNPLAAATQAMQQEPPEEAPAPAPPAPEPEPQPERIPYRQFLRRASA